MKRWVLFCGLALFFSAAAFAQEETPKVEVFGGYTFLHLGYQGTGNTSLSDNLSGGSVSGCYNLRHWLGVVADFGLYHGGASSINGNITSYQIGPKVAFRRMGKLTPFGQFLVGGARISGVGGYSQNDLAVTFGGGADYRLRQRLSVRVVQAEDMITKFTDGVNNRQNDVRISAGIVLRF
jgi:hypothetical protein